MLPTGTRVDIVQVIVEQSISVAVRCVETGCEFVSRAKGEASVFDLGQMA